MKTLTSIVAAIDFSEYARSAAERAALIAKEQAATLRLLHVISGSSLDDLRNVLRGSAEIEAAVIEEANIKLRETATALNKSTGVTAQEEVATGQVIAKIRAAAEAADLLVLGARGTNPLRDLVLGTTAERLLRTCRRPSLVVKRAPNKTYQRLIVPVDFSAYSAPALTMARQVAPHARISIVHAFRVPFEGRLRIAGATEEAIRRYCDEERQEAGRCIDQLIAECLPSTQRAACIVEQGDPSPVILAQVQAQAADLIVIGKQGQSRAEELLLGSVTRHILAGSSCDILVVSP
ncbi:MAG: universal stress protein [Nitrospira sp.]|nr:universal stress protein [Nitrospira sp.]